MQHTIHTSVHPPCLWNEPVTNPYKLLEEFFDYTSVHLQHQYTEKFINAACTQNSVKENPGQLLTWYEKTQVLFYAANLIHQSNYDKEIDLGIDVAKLGWKEQPHHLQDYEVKDPYITIEDCFEFMPCHQWLIELHTWLHAAFYEYSVLEEVSRSTETIALLHKLADAMWLLWLKHSGTKMNQDPEPGTGSQTPMDHPSPPANNSCHSQLKTLVAGFFAAQSATQAKAELWETTKMALTNHDEEPGAKQRSNMLFLYEQLCELLDALEQINKEN